MPPLTQLAAAEPQLLTALASVQAAIQHKVETPKPTLRVRAPAQKTNWKRYRALFNDIDPVVKI